MGVLERLLGRHLDSGRWFLRAYQTFAALRDKHMAGRTLADFLSAFKWAGPEDCKALEALWRKAGLGEFPALPPDNP